MRWPPFAVAICRVPLAVCTVPGPRPTHTRTLDPCAMPVHDTVTVPAVGTDKPGNTSTDPKLRPEKLAEQLSACAGAATGGTSQARTAASVESACRTRVVIGIRPRG